MIKEAIILAGGMGTRLQPVVADIPKCLAPVNGVSFIKYVIEYLQSQGVSEFIFALGYKSDVFEEFLKKEMPALKYTLSVETEPLGTGGAIRLALSHVKEKSVIVANGDTLFKIDVTELAGFHELSGANCTLSLKCMKDFDRYGVIELNDDCSIESFEEKKYYEEGLINGGVYALNVEKFLHEELPEKFSFEKDYLEALYKERRMFGLEQDEYFIDIGTPEDYERAQKELK